MFRILKKPLYNRTFSSSAKDIFQKSCYSKVNYKINHNDTVQKAVNLFASLDIGCLAVVDDFGQFVGVFSEGDFIKKIACSGKEPNSFQLKEICTKAPNILIAKPGDSLEECMGKMHLKKVRHLPIIEERELKGLISIKDLFVETIHQNKSLIKRLSDFKLGKGAYYGSE